MLRVPSVVNGTPVGESPIDRLWLLPPANLARQSRAHLDLADLRASLAAYQRVWALESTPRGSPAWRARDLADWWERARRLALDAGCLLPPVAPAGEVSEREYAIYLDALAQWLSTVARPVTALAPQAAMVLAARLRPTAKDRRITPAGYLALIDDLDRARGAHPDGGHTGA